MAGLPSDVISSLRRTSIVADADLVSSRVAGVSKQLALPVLTWQPPPAVKNAVSDGLLLGTGCGTGWSITSNGDVGHLTLKLHCSQTRKKNVESLITIRSLPPGLWKISHTPGLSESTYSSLLALIQDFQKLEQTRMLTPRFEDKVIKLPIVTTFIWIGERFLGPDGHPDSSTISSGLVIRNQRALSLESVHIEGAGLQPVDLAQVHLPLWSFNGGTFVVGNMVDSNLYFLCSPDSEVAYCSYSAEDILTLGLRHGC